MENQDFNISDLTDRLKKISKVPKINFRFKGKLSMFFFLIILIVLVYNWLFVYIYPNEFGVKIAKFGGGVQDEVYTTGLNFLIPFIEEMHYFPQDKQVLELTNYPSTAARGVRIDSAAHIQTSDGFFVDVDVSIIYHLINPVTVYNTIGPGTLYEDNGIIPKAVPALKATLGELTTEEFYVSPIRVKKTEAAKDLLNKELNEKGIEVDYVLVRYFKYSNEIQKNIEEKKLKDQLVFKNQAEAKAAIEGAELQKIEQEGKMNVAVELEKGKAYVTKKRAEMDLYARKKKAEANLLVKLAEAEKVRLRNDALKGAGAERMVGLKMAEVYQGLDIIILPSDGPNGVNPLDLDNTLRLFDVRKGGAQ